MNEHIGKKVVIHEPPGKFDKNDYRGKIGVISFFSYGEYGVMCENKIIYCKLHNLEFIGDDNE
jgi:hypothetical protein